MGRNRVLLWALAVSLVAHFWLLGSAGEVWFKPVPELEFPIEANLLEPVPAPVVPPKPTPRAAASPAPAALSDPVPESGQASEPAPAAEPESMPTSTPEPPPDEPALSSPTAPVSPTAPKAPARPVVRSFSNDLTIRYSVQTGEGDSGFVAGRATYIWHSQQGRYSLVSTLEATGIASLFISGRIIQVSEGVIDAYGLHPDQYWLKRNERKQDVARFDWGLNQLTLDGHGGVALSPQAQDLLSLPFHLAMTASEGDRDFLMGVTNGRKFNEFGFRALGRERIELKGLQLETLHLQGARAGEGTLDVWLDLARSGLPARIRTVDRKGKVMELRLEGAEKTAGGSGG